MRLLVIEDSEILRHSLARGLRESGYAVDVSGDGEGGLHLAESEDYDVIILDLVLPRMNGLEVLQRIRTKGQATHVIILTAKDTVEDRVRGLSTGADDYLVKPFAFDELLARVQALCRRKYQHKSPQLMIGDLAIDTSARRVSLQGKPVELRPREFMLLEYLAMRRGQVVSRAEIESHIYADAAELMSNAVDSAICSLRKKLCLPGSHPVIQTRRGLGYVLELATESCPGQFSDDSR